MKSRINNNPVHFFSFSVLQQQPSGQLQTQRKGKTR
jgi:hypothetical protein